MSSPAVPPSSSSSTDGNGTNASVLGPVSYYYQSSAAPATPLWTAPHASETLISLICRPVSGSGHGVTARFEKLIGERLLHFGLLHNESGVVFDFNDPVGNAIPSGDASTPSSSANNTTINTDGSRVESKVAVAMPVILSVTSPSAPSSASVSTVSASTSTYVQSVEGVPDSHNAAILPVASPVPSTPPVATAVSPHGHHHTIHHATSPVDDKSNGSSASNSSSSSGAMMKVIARPAALYSDLRQFMRQKGDARFRSHTLEDFAHGQPVWYIHHGLTQEQQMAALKRAIAVDEAGGLVPDSQGRARPYDAVRWNCQHVLFWIMSGTDLPPDAHPGLDSGQIGLVADKARIAVREGQAAAVAVADSVTKGVNATVNAAKQVVERYPVQTAAVTAAATGALVGLGIWARSASASLRGRAASSSPPPEGAVLSVVPPVTATPVDPTRARGNSSSATPAKK